MFVSSRYVAFFLLLEHLLYQSVNLYLDDARYIPFFVEYSIASIASVPQKLHAISFTSHGANLFMFCFSSHIFLVSTFSCTRSFKQLSLLYKHECLIDGLSYHTRILHFLATKICLLVGVQKGIINQ